MTTEITKEEYMGLVKGLKPIESFSDPDGILPFGYGMPAMDTVWGTDSEHPVVECQMRKESRHQQDWEYKYFKL